MSCLPSPPPSILLFYLLVDFQRMGNLPTAIFMNRRMDLPGRDAHESFKMTFFLFTLSSLKFSCIIPMCSLSHIQRGWTRTLLFVGTDSENVALGLYLEEWHQLLMKNIDNSALLLNKHKQTNIFFNILTCVNIQCLLDNTWICLGRVGKETSVQIWLFFFLDAHLHFSDDSMQHRLIYAKGDQWFFIFKSSINKRPK